MNREWDIDKDGRQPMIEDDLLWETSFDGRQHLTECDNLRQTSMEDDL